MNIKWHHVAACQVVGGPQQHIQQTYNVHVQHCGLQNADTWHDKRIIDDWDMDFSGSNFHWFHNNFDIMADILPSYEFLVSSLEPFDEDNSSTFVATDIVVDFVSNLNEES